MDYENLIKSITPNQIKELLVSLKVPYEEKDGYLICSTACHNIDLENASHKLYYYYNNNIFICYTHCGAMNIFDFLKHYYIIRNINYNWYSDILNPILEHSGYNNLNEIKKYSSKKDNYMKRKTIELPEYSKSVLDIFTPYYTSEWINEGITKETMKKFNILYYNNYNIIIIPHYDINNRLVGIRGRLLNEEDSSNYGKYMPITVENITYKHPLSLNLYGLNLTKNNIKQNGYCYVFEGEKSVLKLNSFSIPNCGVAVCGSNFNKYLVKLLMKYCSPKEIIICFDKENKGNNLNYFNKLKKICLRYKEYCHFSFIYDDKNLLDLKDSPVDKGEKIFLQLLSKRYRMS